jgi:hypothetical protein
MMTTFENLIDVLWNNLDDPDKAPALAEILMREFVILETERSEG